MSRKGRGVRVKRKIRRLVRRLRRLRAVSLEGLTAKGQEELGYWSRRRASEKRLRNSWYRYFFIEHFGLDDAFFRGKRVLDIGCGPRGSLEWAEMAKLRLGIDPLAQRYVPLGTRHHVMKYAVAVAENLPVLDGSFDVVSSFNSLDHTDVLRHVTQEIVRVLAPGGHFLLIVDINHDPTASEPLRLGWDVIDEFAPPLRLVEQRHFERAGHGVYQSIVEGGPYDHGRGSDRRGTLSALFQKPSEARVSETE